MNSLLDQIKSKYILQDILSLAFEDMKSVYNLIKYNKNLLNKLNIDFKKKFKNIGDNYKYKKEIIKKGDCCNKIDKISLIEDIVKSILLFIYLILYYIRGTLNQINLKKDYDKAKAKFVENMDKYIILIYFIYLIISFVINILLIMARFCFLYDGIIKCGLAFFNFFIKLIHFILHLVKFIYESNIGEISIGKAKDDPYHYWFYIIDFIILLSYIIFFAAMIYNIYNSLFFHFEILYLYQFKGINIIDYYLPDSFDDLNKIEKYKFLLEKGNVYEYEYELNKSQIDLINKINDIRKKNNLSLLKFNHINEIPEFIINEKTELFFYKFKNIYRLNKNSYVFKYPSKKFINILYNSEILSIITNPILDRIKFIEKNNIQFINIYYNEPIPIVIPNVIRYIPNNNSNNINQLNNENNIIEIKRNSSNITKNKSRNSIKINEEEKDIANTNDKLENKSESNFNSAFDVDDENEIQIIKSINFE